MTAASANIYTTAATATGGREGHVETDDQRLKADLTRPGEAGEGTNPEQLFAAGYAACFQGALMVVARRQKIDLDPANTITARVGLKKDGLAYALDVELEGHFPGLTREQGEELMHAAHQVCPYSMATRGNVDVRLVVKG